MSEKQFKFEVYVDYWDGDGNITGEPMMGTQKEIKRYIQDALKAHLSGHELEEYLPYIQVVSKRSNK